MQLFVKTHGMWRSPEYNSWAAMKQRCTNPKHIAFNHYGGRGITICERWVKFENFLADMGKRPSSAYSLDRIDTNGNYEPGNCRWATHSQQICNRRGSSGECSAEWPLLIPVAKALGITPGALRFRIRKHGSLGFPPRKKYKVRASRCLAS